MNMIRSDLQTALNDLHVLCQESIEQYRGLAEFCDSQAATAMMLEVADKRAALSEELEQAIRDSGDLPSDPDPDRETGMQLVQRLHSLFSTDQTQDLVQQRLDAETALAERLELLADNDPGQPFPSLLSSFQDKVAEAQQQLKHFLDRNDS